MVLRSPGTHTHTNEHSALAYGWTRELDADLSICNLARYAKLWSPKQVVIVIGPIWHYNSKTNRKSTFVTIKPFVLSSKCPSISPLEIQQVNKVNFGIEQSSPCSHCLLRGKGARAGGSDKSLVLARHFCWVKVRLGLSERPRFVLERSHDLSKASFRRIWLPSDCDDMEAVMTVPCES